MGIFFPSDDREIIRDNFFSGAAYDYPVYSNQTQIISMHGWKKDSIQKGAVTERWNISTFNYSFSPAAFVLRVGKSLSWTKVLKGEIAEIRIYNRALTRRERCRIEFELCSRYGESWEGHGIIDSKALSWHGESAQFGLVADKGEPDEELASTVSSGGATLELLTPSILEGREGYFSNNGGAGVTRIWYVSTYNSTRQLTDIKLTFDKSKVRLGANPSLYYSSRYYSATQDSILILPTKVTTVTVEETDDSVSFTLPKECWWNGFYTVRGDLDSHLAMWYRADMGLETNAVGGVTKWGNSGKFGEYFDMLPQVDNSAAHIAYSADGMGGKPTVTFDGTADAYLKSINSGTMGISTAGSAWFVVCKTDMDKDHRGNMVPFGCSNNGTGQRFGCFFSNNADASKGQLRGYIFNSSGAVDAPQLEEGKPQVFAMLHWTSGGTHVRGIMNGSTTGGIGNMGAPTVVADRVCIGGSMGYTWTSVFNGDIAELRIYNRALTARERSEVQIELCSRYGVSWTGHGGIDDEALGWCANSAQFGYDYRIGQPEDVVTNATVGGATLTLGAVPASNVDSQGYLAYNGSNSFDRVWYVSAASAALQQPMSFSLRCADYGRSSRPLDLYHSDSATGPWRLVGTCMTPVDGRCTFSFGANEWSSGFYRADKVPGSMIIVF